MTEACLSSLLTYTCWSTYEKDVHSSLVRYWLASSGAAHAIEILTNGEARWWLSHEKRLVARVVTKEQQAINPDKVESESWTIVRSFLASADDETYALALAAATKAWEKAAVGMRCGLAYAFHEQQDWAREALEDCTRFAKERKQQPLCAALLFATRRDVEFLRSVQKVCDLFGDSPYAVIDALGPDALPILRTQFSQLKKAFRPKLAEKEATKWMTLIESADVAAFLAESLSVKHLQPSIKKYLESVPHLAILALETRRKNPECKKLLKDLSKKYPEALAAVRAR